MSYELIETIKSDPNIYDSIITDDESCCFAYDPETKCQSSKWCGLNTPVLQKISISKIKCKDAADFVFGNKGVIHHEYVPEGQTVHATFYL